MKFNVGDEVRIVKKSNIHINWTEDMELTIGLVGVVEKISQVSKNSNECSYCYMVQVENYYFAYDEESLDFSSSDIVSEDKESISLKLYEIDLQLYELGLASDLMQRVTKRGEELQILIKNNYIRCQEDINESEKILLKNKSELSQLLEIINVANDIGYSVKLEKK